MTDEAQTLDRVETHVPGLDTILKGGLMKGGVYLVMAVPGAGKTILGNQICFNHAATGGRAVYLTILTESHGRMLSALASMSFFDEQRLANEVTYLSGYQALETGKLDGLLKLIRKAIHDQRASLLVIDGLVTASTLGGSDIALKEFIHELQVFIEMVGCTTLLLTGIRDEEANYPERTMVDGLFLLTKRRVGMRTVREFEVSKFRGSDNILGAHVFDISETGITIHPRTESVAGHRPAVVRDNASMGFGVASLDTMLGGGPRRGSNTLLVGGTGSGKTTLGMQFLVHGAHQGQPGLHFGFFESPERLRPRMKNISLELTGHEQSGMLFLYSIPPLELAADAVVEKLLAHVKRNKIQRLFIDGLQPMVHSLIYPGRVSPFLFALTSELRSLGVTTVISDETPQVSGRDLRLPSLGVAEIIDNIVVLRYSEVLGRLRRSLSVLKTREDAYDTALHEFTISSAGISVGSAAMPIVVTKTKSPAASKRKTTAKKSASAKPHAPKRGTNKPSPSGGKSARRR